MKRFTTPALLAALALVIIVGGFYLIDGNNNAPVIESNAVFAAADFDATGFTRAIDPYAWEFPRDHGAHPDFQTEWWYYTGNIADETGRRFGYQFTIFRRGILPPTLIQDSDTDSEWRTNQLYLAHFTVTDVDGNAFYHDERFSRGSADLAGATHEPRYRVWLENWQIQANDDDAKTITIRAQSDQFAIDLTLDETKAPVLQGINGLSAKSPEIGNASYYYSMPLYTTQGTLTINDRAFQVSGSSWMDHEFSTSAISDNSIGWDWFSIQLDNDYQMMLGYLRLEDGGRFDNGSSLILPDGSRRPLAAHEFSIETIDTWTSPHTNATYPAKWHIKIDAEGIDPIDITLTPQIADQELQANITSYWEGTVRIEGTASGYGYVELTGYVEPMAARF